MSDDGRAAATTTDTRALEHLARAARARYPSVPTEVITDRVNSAYQRYAQATVRDFVPLLVERELDAELRASRGARVAPD